MIRSLGVDKFTVAFFFFNIAFKPSSIEYLRCIKKSKQSSFFV